MKYMAEHTIAFIGGGNMATSLVGGLVGEACAPGSVWVADPSPERRQDLRARFQVNAVADNVEAAGHADTLVLAVKPQVMGAAVREVADAVREHRPLVVSIAAGVREPDIRRWLGFDAAVVRTMPNTPALVGAGASALYANTHVSTTQRSRAESVLRAVGATLWVDDESMLDAVTALSGSGPAYLFLVMELMERAGRELGLPAEAARMLTLQTAFGAAKMALESPEEPATLRARVTSPGGTTERAINHMLEQGIETLFVDALRCARDRSVELGKMLGDE